jgi:hypothetical protein
MSDDTILAGLARLEAGLLALEAGQTKLRTDFLDELGKTRADIMGKVAELQDAVTAIRDDIAVNMGAVGKRAVSRQRAKK